MALGLAFLTELIELKRSAALDGCRRVIEIGAQQLSDPFLQATDSLVELYRLFGRLRPHLGDPSGSAALSLKAPSSREFWQSLGLEYTAIDYDGHRDSHALDLNHDRVPDALRGKFDLVVNTGTTEHVANQDNAFKVVHDLVRSRGIMIHEVPVCLFGHGLLNYSPNFFIQLFRQNGYDPLFIRVRTSGEEQIPRYVHAMNRRWGNGHAFDFETIREFTISAAFRRRGRRGYVTPLDLPRRMMSRQYILSPRTWKHLWPLR